MNKYKWFSVIAMLGLLVGLFPVAGSSSLAQGTTRTFPETGHTIKGLFLSYWDTHGGLSQQGYPISAEVQEVSDTDGKAYTMQYFERAIFEMHPENAAPFNVLLSLVGAFSYSQRYGGNAPNQHANPDNARRFNETGKTLGGAFRQYWETHGGLAQQGYPISDEFQEISQTDGKTYTVQYFERAVFEFHPEYANTPNIVLLSLLGVFFYNQRHGSTQPTTQPQQPAPTNTTQPQPPAAPTNTPVPPTQTATKTPIPTSTSTTLPTSTATPAPAGVTTQILFFKGDGLGQTALIDSTGAIFYQQQFQLNTPNWTHVLSLGGGYVFFYKQVAVGGRIGKINEDGSYENVRVGLPFAGGWSQIASFESKLLFYKQSTTGAGPLNTVQLTYPIDGTYTDLGTSNFSSCKLMDATRNGQVLCIYEDAQLGVSIAFTFGIDAQGSPHYLKQYNNFPLGFTNVIRTHNDYFFLYNSSNGTAMFTKVGLDGTMTNSPVHNWPAHISSFADTPGGVLIAYDKSTGRLFSEEPDYNGQYRALKDYPSLGGPSWDFVVSVR